MSEVREFWINDPRKDDFTEVWEEDPGDNWRMHFHAQPIHVIDKASFDLVVEALEKTACGQRLTDTEGEVWIRLADIKAVIEETLARVKR